MQSTNGRNFGKVGGATVVVMIIASHASFLARPSDASGRDRLALVDKEPRPSATITPIVEEFYACWGGRLIVKNVEGRLFVETCGGRLLDKN